MKLFDRFAKDLLGESIRVRIGRVKRVDTMLVTE